MYNVSKGNTACICTFLEDYSQTDSTKNILRVFIKCYMRKQIVLQLE